MKKQLSKILFNIYKPIVIRTEIYKASRLWKKGIKQCRKDFKRVGAPRFYMIYDHNTNSFMNIVYNRRRKADAISLKGLQIAGKIHAKRSMTVMDLMRESFYYTESKHGAPECNNNEKLKEWIAYYFVKISKPMEKIRKYQSKNF